jgi:hypothetical protein
LSESIPKKPHEDPLCTCLECLVILYEERTSILYSEHWTGVKPEVSEEVMRAILEDPPKWLDDGGWKPLTTRPKG